MWLEVKRLFNWGAAPMVSFISFVFAATINKLPLTKRERGFISAFLPTAAPADKGLGRCDHWHIFNDWLNEFPISDSQRKDKDYFFSIDSLWYHHCTVLVTALYQSWVLLIVFFKITCILLSPKNKCLETFLKTFLFETNYTWVRFFPNIISRVEYWANFDLSDHTC